MRHTIVVRSMATAVLDLPTTWSHALPSVQDMLISGSNMEQSAIVALLSTPTLSVKAMKVAAVWPVLRTRLKSVAAPIFSIYTTSMLRRR